MDKNIVKGKQQDLEKQRKKQQLKIKKKWQTLDIKVSKQLRDIIHGYIMSDGYVRNGILTIDQGEKQKRFVIWLYDKLQTIRTTSPIAEVARVHPKTKQNNRSFRFFTRALLHGFCHMWYTSFIDQYGVRKIKKNLPKNIDCFFNETFISVWFAGDGTKIVGSVGAKFEVTCFTVSERLKLKKLFLSRFNIKTQILLAGLSNKSNPQWVLKIPANEYPKFRNLITKIDLIPSVFPHKLHKKQ